MEIIKIKIAAQKLLSHRFRNSTAKRKNQPGEKVKPSVYKIYGKLGRIDAGLIFRRKNQYREEKEREIQNFRKKFDRLEFIQNCVQFGAIFR